MFTKLLRRTQEEKGFTLIELLVVILIIGILAAIAIPAFLNQKGKAYDSNAKSDARTAATAQETYFTDNNAFAATAQLGSITSIEPTLNQAAARGQREPDRRGSRHREVRCNAGRHASTAANSYRRDRDVEVRRVKYAYIRQADGTVSRTCDIPGARTPAAARSHLAPAGTW